MEWTLKGSAKEYARVVRACAAKMGDAYGSGCRGCVFYDIGDDPCDGIELVVDFELIAEADNG